MFEHIAFYSRILGLKNHPCSFHYLDGSTTLLGLKQVPTYSRTARFCTRADQSKSHRRVGRVHIDPYEARSCALL